jgi:drug/metabolite transporter (DMT)-like permease
MGLTLAPIFIRLLKDDYEPITLGFVRNGFGSAFLIGLCLIYYRPALLALIRKPWPVFGIGVLNSFQTYTWNAGIYSTSATTAQLVLKLNVVFVAVFAFILFHEERAVIRSPRFLIGTGLSLVGVAGVLVRDTTELAHVFAPGNLLLLVTAVSWSVYAVWGKHIVLDIHPVPMFAVVSAITTIALGITFPIFEDPGGVFRVGMGTTLLAALSAVIGVSLAQSTFHYAQRHFGSAFVNTFLLIVPLTTYVVANIFLPGESLTPTQMTGAAVLLTGTLLIMTVENQEAEGEPEHDTTL